MKKILLISPTGMTTTLLVDRINKDLENLNIKSEIIVSEPSCYQDEATKSDVILLAPQFEYLYSEIKTLYPNKPSDIIDIESYTHNNSSSVVNRILEII